MGFKIIKGVSENKLPRDIEYWKERDIFLDCRGEIDIHPSVMFGFNIYIYTMSHDKNDYRKCYYKTVKIEKDVWICSNAILYNCTIGEGSIVGMGAVVRSMDVQSCTMVVGNPARIIALFDKIERVWKYL